MATFECSACGSTWTRSLKNEWHYHQCIIGRSPRLAAIARESTQGWTS